MRSIFERPYIAPLFLFALTFAAHSGNLCAGFVYDDNVVVLENPWILDLNHLPEIFTTSVWAFIQGSPDSNYYRPGLHLIYIAERFFFGIKPWGYHLTSILIHSANAVLVFAIVRRLAGPQAMAVPAMLGALVFALHPINAEAVSWVSSQSDLGYPFFFLLSFLLYARYRGKGDAATFIASVFAFALALLFKETAITLPMAMVAFDLAQRGARGTLRGWLAYLPYALVGALYIVLRSYAVGGAFRHTEFEMGLYDSVASVPAYLVKYVVKLLAPINLMAIYPVDASPGVLLPIFGLAMVVVIALLLRLKKWREAMPVVGLSFVFATILPVLYIPVVSRGGFADRYLYVSSAGMALLISWALYRVYNARGSSWQRTAFFGAIALCVVFALGTIWRERVWRDELSLWADTVAKNPASENARYNLAWAYHKRSALAMAEKEYIETLRLNPKKDGAYYNLALIYQSAGEGAKAISYYESALALNPGNAKALYNLGYLRQTSGDLQGAIALYTRLLEIDPGNEDAHFNMARAYEDGKDHEGALLHYGEVLRINPGATDARVRLEALRPQSGKAH